MVRNPSALKNFDDTKIERKTRDSRHVFFLPSKSLCAIIDISQLFFYKYKDYIMKLCVIVPAKDEGVVIAKTLENLIQAGMSPRDIFVIDDGSSDGTGEISKSYGVNVLRNETNIGKAESVAKVVAHFYLTSCYDLIALMDADTKVSPGYFVGIQESFLKDENVVVVCGYTKSAKHNWLTAYRSVAYFVSHFVYKVAQSKMGVITVAPGCSTTYRASIFQELDWASDTLVEDMDVTVQVHRKGLGKIVYQDKSMVYTQDPKTLHDYIKQMYRWDVGTWQVLRKYSIFTGVKKLDWEYKLLMIEGVIFSVIYVLWPLWFAFFPVIVIKLILLEFCVIALIATVVAISEKRMDVIIYSPTFPFVRYLDCFLLLYSFWNIIVRRKHVSTWFSVSRYSNATERLKTSKENKTVCFKSTTKDY